MTKLSPIETDEFLLSADSTQKGYVAHVYPRPNRDPTLSDILDRNGQRWLLRQLDTPRGDVLFVGVQKLGPHPIGLRDA